MSISVVIGGQYGSEGKGKVSYFFAKKLNAVAVVRVGGTNSGHTIIDEVGKEHIFRTLPTSAIDKDIVSVLPSGSYIDVSILLDEIRSVQLPTNKLKIDPYAVIIDESMKQAERDKKLQDRIGSTESGTGEAVIQRLQRLGNVKFAKDEQLLSEYIIDTKEYMRGLLNEQKNIIIEGTQGFGLSPINSDFYPFCTSRDTTAANFVMESGLSPLDVENIIMVIRSYPIRVAGRSGELKNELSWEQISNSAGCDGDLTEITSATKRVRRVAEFEPEVVKRAILVNNPNIIVLNHMDYIDYSCHDSNSLSEKICKYVHKIENDINSNVNFIGLGKNKTLGV